MYDPTIGRWLSEDPTGFDAGDANLYRYVGNGPTDGVDPSGLDTVPTGKNPVIDEVRRRFPGGKISDPKLLDEVKSEIDFLEGSNRSDQKEISGLERIEAATKTGRKRAIGTIIIDIIDPRLGMGTKGKRIMQQGKSINDDFIRAAEIGASIDTRKGKIKERQPIIDELKKIRDTNN